MDGVANSQNLIGVKDGMALATLLNASDNALVIKTVAFT
jgi:hypothetical protein